MTKRKTPTKQAPQAPTETVESVKQETNTKVASKPKQAKTTAKKASTGGRRGRPKKAKVVEAEKALDIESRTITYVAPNRAILVSEPPVSLYSRFKDWLVLKLYYVSSFFRGY